MKTKPRLPQHLRRASILRIRVRRSERRIIEQGAKDAGLSIAQFLREKALVILPRVGAPEVMRSGGQREESDQPGQGGDSSRQRRRGSR